MKQSSKQSSRLYGILGTCLGSKEKILQGVRKMSDWESMDDDDGDDNDNDNDGGDDDGDDRW